MTALADEIRLATSRNELHPLVRDNWASPRGICNCSTEIIGNGRVFCQRDYRHEGVHVNGLEQWRETWPPPPSTAERPPPVKLVPYTGQQHKGGRAISPCERFPFGICHDKTCWCRPQLIEGKRVVVMCTACGLTFEGSGCPHHSAEFR